LFDSLSNIRTVVTLRLERSMESGLMAKVGVLLSPFRRNIRINEWKWFVADTLVTLTYCVIAIGYVYEHWKPGEVFYVGGLVTLIGYVNQFTSVFHDVAWQYTQIVQYNTDVETAKSISNAWEAQHRPDAARDLPSNWRTIEISNLNFSHREAYDDAHAPQSLHGLHLRLERGKKVALIGESGCGKTTLLALLRGLYDPEPGFRLSVDGKPEGLDTLNETVTLFPQEPEIFENTIAYNITLDLPVPEQEVKQVCEWAHFSEVIAELPKGLESNIQEKGVNLSGGQILAARDSQVVLMDEPTSSVDPKTETFIYENLFRALGDKAIVSALHRLHLLRHFDYIYVLNKGRIVAEGDFPSLLANSTEFQELWRHQAERNKV
jgi:ATP-binding cassette, subfamily B, bacterial